MLSKNFDSDLNSEIDLNFEFDTLEICVIYINYTYYNYIHVLIFVQHHLL